ncbi:NAD(P)H-dependent FMN reductase [Neorhizobium huautlense]|uniref:NAD(P)H-dependent FMN reductase n=1 Tax=Neorhizobium huautlense TaxID=67774 RepID=A0ABT9PVV2_9HYPH|nr:NADPH-dependent FMN reductase [Neorhizobium huautlense]MDP9838233.1 NAD(P)H-dependent FMN reductase [Neorhizobium huautlense]
MVKLVGISGSLRNRSFNTSLLNAAAVHLPEGVTLTKGTISGIPLYNADEEAEGIPQAVTVLKRQISEADGVILFTPEYNNSIPGVFKNAIDWLSRPHPDIADVFKGRPFAIAGASPGNFGTLLSQNAWLTVLHTLGADAWSGKRLMVGSAAKVFDAEGRITDEAVAKRLGDFVGGFAAYVAAKG